MNTERIPHYQTKRDSHTTATLQEQKLVGDVELGEYRGRRDTYNEAHVIYTMRSLAYPFGRVVALTIIWR